MKQDSGEIVVENSPFQINIIVINILIIIINAQNGSRGSGLFVGWIPTELALPDSHR